MTTPVFPTSLPGVSSHSWEIDPQLVISEGDGPKDFRRRTRVPSATAEVTWKFKPEQFEDFQNFWKVDLIRGHRWFLLKLPCGAGIAYHYVRFIEHRNAGYDGKGLRTITGRLFVRDRVFRPAIEEIYITTTPYPTYGFDGLNTSLAVISGSLAANIGYADDAIDVTMDLTGTLRVALLIQDQLDESLDTSLIVQSGTLANAYIIYDGGDEGFDSDLVIASGSLAVTLIITEIPVESIDTSLTVVSGTLV